MKDLPATEERVWAVLAHLSVLALGMGIVLPVVGWSEQRRKSKYASFQCLQALGYQSLGITIWLLFMLVVIICVVIVYMRAIRSTSMLLEPEILGEVWLLIFITFLFSFSLYILLPMVAAIMCALGRDFHYPLMGNRLAKYLGYDASRSDEQTWLIEDHEDHWVVAIGHFSVIIALWGMLAPLTVWIMQGRRSVFLKFQSIQTLIYQAGVALFSIIPLGILLGFSSIIGFGHRSVFDSLSGLILLLVILIFAILFTSILPLFHTLGQWAGYRVLKGDDYLYPIIGKLIEKRLAKEGSAMAQREQAP